LAIFAKKQQFSVALPMPWILGRLRYRAVQRLKRIGQSSIALKKNFFAWGCRFFVSDVISGGLLGHLGPLCLALGANR